MSASAERVLAQSTQDRCIGLYRGVSDANVRKRAQDHGTPAGLNAAPAAHFTAPNEPSRFRDLRTLCLYSR